MKILAVDDDLLILELLREVLRVAGFSNLHLCSSGDEALHMIRQAEVPFDCFLLDIQMPEMDGIELTAAIRNMPGYAKSPILMITAMSDRSYVENAFAAGASDYIMKPFEIGEVHARLRLMETLVQERKQMDDRNPVEMPGSPVSIVTPHDLHRCLSLTKVDGFIDYLALENYLLQMSRVSHSGLSVFAVVTADMERVFQASSQYEYGAAMSDLAWAISDCLRPQSFFAAHAGGGAFVCVLMEPSQFDAEGYEAALSNAVQNMDLRFCDGRPMPLNPVVGPALPLQFKSLRAGAQALEQAVESAKAIAENPDPKQAKTSSPIKLLFGL